jgi:chromosome segregation ATPase
MSQAIQRGIVILAVLLVAAVGISVFALVQKKALEEQNQTLQDQLTDAKIKQEKVLSDSKNLQQQIQKLQQDNSDYDKRLTDKDREKEQLQASYDDVKRKSDDLSAQAEQANRDRDDWKSRLETIRKERDELIDKLQHQPEKIVYKDRPVEESVDQTASDAPSSNAQGDEYWAKVLKQKAKLEVDLDKAKSDLDKTALQVADLRKQNSDLTLQIKDLTNDKVEIERRLTNEKKRLEDNYARERQDLQRRIKDGEDLASNLSMEVARSRGDQKSANEFGSKVKEDNVQMQAQVRQLASTKVALEKTVARLRQEKEDMSKRLADTEGVIQNRINEIWQIKQTLDQKIVQMNQSKSDKEVELPPIIVNGSGNGSSNAATPSVEANHKIISINPKNNFVIIDYGQTQGSTIGRVFKAYRGDQEIATLEVIQVRRDISAADIKEQKTNLQVGDQVR